ncbi:MAG TPA: type II toxin-antitoxin system HicB family antitoxin [Chloroflexi bacterium]|nr:type II toxin-antitoxin system HicB family antitoxin [Chloroflexota bacterium]
MTYAYTVIIRPDPESPGWWNAEVPALPGCVSCGRSFDEALAMIREAIEGYLAVLLEEGEEAPRDVMSARIPVEVDRAPTPA